MNKSINKSVFGISFDGVAMSGIIAEFLKIAHVLHQEKYNIYLDLGYEIKSDKNHFFMPYGLEWQLFPDWVGLVKVLSEPFKQYSCKLIKELLSIVPQSSKVFSVYKNTIKDYSNEIAMKLVNLWQQLNVKIVIVENGTLPENLIFTYALYKAINVYGKNYGLKKFVFWRDHDLMWSSESHINKYGMFPYLNIPKPQASPYINYIVLHQADHDALIKWSPAVKPYILYNSFQHLIQDQSDATRVQSIRKRFRNQFNIPEDAILLARYTRIIPQKRIDRDIDLLNALQKLARSRQQTSKFYLAIAGDLSEHPKETECLRLKIHSLGLEKYVVFTGPLVPAASMSTNSLHHTKNLITASDACLFLTSYNYESFGNPVAEAICLNKVYITTTYERYHHVYGQYGYKGLILDINENDEADISQEFVIRVYEILHDKSRYDRMVKHNRIAMDQQQKLKADLSASLHTIFNDHF